MTTQSGEFNLVRPIFETESGTKYFIDIKTGYSRRGNEENNYLLLGSITESLYEKSLDTLEEAVSQVPGRRPATVRNRGFVDIATEQLHYILNVSKEGFTHTFELGNYAIGLACNPGNIVAVGPNLIVFNRDFLIAMYDERGIVPAIPIVTTPIHKIFYQPTSEERKIKFRV